MATKVVNAVMRATKRAANKEKFAYVRVPRDPGERAALFSEHGSALTSPGQLYSQGPAGMAARKALRWRGQGGYWSELAKSAWDSSAGIRAQAGNWARSGAGGSLGLAAGHLSRYLGTGDYTVDNALVGAGLSSAGIPTFGPEQQTYKVQKSEFIRNIYAPQTAGVFENLVLPLQPGIESTFPWLALVAPQFEEYEFLQLMFYWRPMVSDFNSGTGQVGEIVMATQYNPSEPPFQDLSRAKNYMGAMSSKTSISMNHGVECDPHKNSGAAGKYIRQGPLQGTNSDLKQYDLGNLNVMISGTPPAYNGQILGELWVAYTVELRKPKLPDTSGSLILRDYFQSSYTGEKPWEEVPTMPTLIGAQNRIGGSLTITRTTGVPDLKFEALVASYVFPSWYTGECKLTFTVFAHTQSVAEGQNGGTILFSTPGPNAVGLVGQVTGNVDMCQYPPRNIDRQLLAGVGAFENITGALVDDSLLQTGAATTTGGVSNGVQSGAGFAGNQSDEFLTYSITVSVSVKENTSGGKNEVSVLPCYTQTNLPYWPKISGWSVDVSEYNSAFNSTTTGDILLVDAEGNPVPQPWT